MQENHSFDNYFGTYPGADGIPKRDLHAGRRRATGGRCVQPFHLGGRAGSRPRSRPPHAPAPVRRGRMDGFVRAASIDRQSGGALGHGLLRRPRPALLLERRRGATSCSTASSPPRPAAAWPTTCSGSPARRAPAAGDPERASASCHDLRPARGAGISWKFYVQDYDPRSSRPRSGRPRLQAVRVPLLSFRATSTIRGSSATSSTSRSTTRTSRAAAAPGRIHRPGRGRASIRPGRVRPASARQKAAHALAHERRLGELGLHVDLRRLGRLVRPRPAAGVDSYGYGFRVPALLVSPYARRGYVDSTRLDTTSILRFIERQLGARAAGPTRRRANSFAGSVRLHAAAARAEHPRRRAQRRGPRRSRGAR